MEQLSSLTPGKISMILLTGKSIKAKIEYFMLDAEGEIIEGTYGEKEMHFEEWVNEWSPLP
jgi:hypothetical protein